MGSVSADDDESVWYNAESLQSGGIDATQGENGQVVESIKSYSVFNNAG